MTEAEKMEQRRQAKIARMTKLKEDYFKMEKGASPAELQALKMESAVLQKRLEVTSRVPMGRACPAYVR